MNVVVLKKKIKHKQNPNTVMKHFELCYKKKWIRPKITG